jgi:hypothetical protein
MPAINFYANPLDPALVKRLLLDPMFAGARALRGVLAQSTALQPVRDAGRAVERQFRIYAHSNRAGMRALERRYDHIPEVRQMADMLATDPGTGRLVRETFQSAHEARARSMTNRAMNLLGRDRDAAHYEAVRDVLTGTVRDAGADARTAAASVRRLLDEQHGYLKAAGVDLGYVRGKYFPRVLTQGCRTGAAPISFWGGVRLRYRFAVPARGRRWC